MSERHSARNRYTTLVLLLEHNVGGLLVDSDSESLQFIFNHLLVDQRLVNVENNENEMACLGDSNNLPPTTFTIFGTLNDTGKIKNLNLRAVV